MKLRLYQNQYTIAHLAAIPATLHQHLANSLYSLTVTSEEISLVCETRLLPSNVTDTNGGWRLLKIEGILDFGMVGIIAATAKVLAERSISIFVISSYNTDIILVRDTQCDAACNTLKDAGYIITDVQQRH